MGWITHAIREGWGHRRRTPEPAGTYVGACPSCSAPVPSFQQPLREERLVRCSSTIYKVFARLGVDAVNFFPLLADVHWARARGRAAKATSTKARRATTIDEVRACGSRGSRSVGNVLTPRKSIHTTSLLAVGEGARSPGNHIGPRCSRLCRPRCARQGRRIGDNEAVEIVAGLALISRRIFRGSRGGLRLDWFTRLRQAPRRRAAGLWGWRGPVARVSQTAPVCPFLARQR